MRKPLQTQANNNSSNVPSIIGQDVQLEGSLVSESEIHLEGQITGNIKCQGCVMGEKSYVKGDIEAHKVTIRGQIDGNVRADIVHLEQTAVINGDVYHDSLTVESGAKLNGHFAHISTAPTLSQIPGFITPKNSTTKAQNSPAEAISTAAE